MVIRVIFPFSNYMRGNMPEYAKPPPIEKSASRATIKIKQKEEKQQQQEKEKQEKQE